MSCHFGFSLSVSQFECYFNSKMLVSHLFMTDLREKQEKKIREQTGDKQKGSSLNRCE